MSQGFFLGGTLLSVHASNEVCYHILFFHCTPNRMLAFLSQVCWHEKVNLIFSVEISSVKSPLLHYTVEYLQQWCLFLSYLEGKAGVCILSGNLGGILMGSIDRYELRDTLSLLVHTAGRSIKKYRNKSIIKGAIVLCNRLRIAKISTCVITFA